MSAQSDALRGHAPGGRALADGLSGSCDGVWVRVARIAASLWLAALLSACSTLPRADKVAELTVTDARAGMTANLPVRWGGTIARVSNSDEGTLLEVVSRPLRSSGRPRHSDESDGRFLARVDDFLDPEIVEAGRDITFVGSVVGTESGKIGEASYTFPVLKVDKFRYWRPEPDRIAYPPGYYPWPPGHPYPGWYHDYWHDHPHYRPAPVRRPAVDGEIDF